MKSRKPNIIHFNFASISVHSTLMLVSLIAIFPVFWMVLTSLKPPGESFSTISSMFTKNPTISNYLSVSNLVPIYRNFFNSVFVSFFGTIATVFFCSLAGFSFAKFDFPGRNALFMVLLATMIIPPEASVIPVFIIMRNLGWINNLLSLIVPRAATAVGIFYMRQYINDFPDELMEQARIDGCNNFKIYWRILIPVIIPAISAWASLALVNRWNDFFWPLIFMRSREMFTLMVSISLLPVSEGLSTPWPVIMAGSSIAVLPLVIMYIVLSRFHLRELTSGAVKG
ncbi:carbohydrate ABC transporter permease [Alkalispirochaeta sphaeroplastigenens]|uniref:carbohydrate ABC transporter permease n=1 Tax=Alkalispirochaeta sphaeroplastigenens TaxID=1187066 RepID=UPI000CDBA34A|nr:carbohydrate ABC transporter permease [Alkalispirochaeta sphaeroplastigenens]